MARIATQPKEPIMPYIIKKDDSPITWRAETENDVLATFHRLVGYSMDHAIEHEGWSVTEATDEVWHELERPQMVAMARQHFHHEHGTATFRDADEEHMVRENCGACVLLGYGDRATREHDYPAPNYTGWPRVYVEAGRGIPAKYLAALVEELTDEDNTRYVDALNRSIRTFGLRVMPA